MLGRSRRAFFRATTPGILAIGCGSATYAYAASKDGEEEGSSPFSLSKSAKIAATAAAALSFIGISAYASMSNNADKGGEEHHLARWIRNWNAGRYSKADVSFHKGHVNPHLKKHEAELHLVPGQTVLVPLCGKTLDMAFLAARGLNVLGVEGVERPIQEFSEENCMPISSPRKELGGAYRLFSALNPFPREIPCEKWSGARPGYVYGRFLRDEDGKEFLGYKVDRPAHIFSPEMQRAPGGTITFAMGDFFTLTPDIVQGKQCDACYDRAALVAIRPTQRKAYVDTIHKMLKPGGRILLVVLEHDGFSDGSKGPPFSVTEADVRRLYDEHRFNISVLDRNDESAKGDRVTSVTYVIRKKKTVGIVRRDSYFNQRYRLMQTQQ